MICSNQSQSPKPHCNTYLFVSDELTMSADPLPRMDPSGLMQPDPPVIMAQRPWELPSFDNYAHRSPGPLVDGIVFLVVLILFMTVAVYQGCLHRKRKSPVQIRRCYSLVLVVSYTSVAMILGKIFGWFHKICSTRIF